MTTSLSNLVDNLTEGINKNKLKDCDCLLEYEIAKENSGKYKCISWKRGYSNKIDEELKKRLNNTFRFSNNDIKKFILLLRKGVYLYESIDDFNYFEIRTLDEYHNLYECIDDFNDFEIRTLDEYHNLYLKNDTLLLANFFENFGEMSLINYHLDSTKFL